MIINVLIENNSGELCQGEHGLSILVETEEIKILFDVGGSSLFLENASKLNIDFEDIDYIVLSHGHWDHGTGLEYMSNKKLVCHPACFTKRYRKRDSKYIGLPINREKVNGNYDLILTDKPYKLSDNTFFLGEIPRKNNFESKFTTFVLENGEEDFVIDDSAIVINSEKGLIIIPGCSHAGICNIIEYAKEVTERNVIDTIIGGLHLLELNDTTNKTIEYLKNQEIKKIYPIHCTNEEVVKRLDKELDSIEIYRTFAGDVVKL